jgi:tetratricopeptide (TPR) repeat protein
VGAALLKRVKAPFLETRLALRMVDQKSTAGKSKATTSLCAGALVALLLGSGLVCGSPCRAADIAKTPPTEAEFKLAKDNLQAAPKDFKMHFALGELYKRSGANKEAVKEYALATELNPAFYVAYHQMAFSNPDSQVVEAAIERLNKLKEEKPRDLLLRVALSELLEQRKEYYHAARTLVDLLYQNAIPEQHIAKVNSRIRLLLGKAKDMQTLEKARGIEDDMEVVIPPLPEASLRRNLHASKIKEPKVMPGVGHAPLLP